MSRLRIIYIVGSGHCGSTLLNLVLNGHSAIAGLSELQMLHDPAEANRPYSAEHVEFWQQIDRRLSQQGLSLKNLRLAAAPFRQMRRWKTENFQRWAEHNMALYRAIAAQSEVEILVDASKSPNRLALLLEIPEIELYVVHLVRDGRAVINSYRRKNWSRWGTYRKWLAVCLACRILNRHAARGWINMKYEDLAANPKLEATRVCKLLGLEFQPSMLDFRQHRHFGIGGNRMRFDGQSDIRLDEKWRRELPAHERTWFALLGGWMNALNGYGVF
jgi:hypothetical protein